MSVNGIELKEGQIWLDASGTKRILSRDNKNPRFPWKGKLLENEEWNSYTNNGMYYGDTPSMIDLVTLISEDETPMKFNPKSEPTKFVPPKPGDKIICNNGEEFICCTKEFLNTTGLAKYYEDKNIFGYQNKSENIYKYDWMTWDGDGKSSYPEWTIREVIPTESKEVVKGEEPRYTVDQVFEAAACAWEVKPWHTSALQEVKDYLQKINDPQYKEYLRLKAIYE